MQTRYNDGRADKLEQLEHPTPEQLARKMEKALADPAVDSVAVHKEGSVLETSDGKMMKVTRKGIEALTPNQRKRERRRRSNRLARRKPARRKSTIKEEFYGSRDIRPQKAGWAPGHYDCVCHSCDKKFIGDKRAVTCADCAYAPVGHTLACAKCGRFIRVKPYGPIMVPWKHKNPMGEQCDGERLEAKKI